MKFHPKLNLIVIRSRIPKDTAIQIEMPGSDKVVRSEVTASGLLVPAKPVNDYTKQIEDKTWEIAEVVEVGPGSYQNGVLVQSGLKPGDIVAYLKQSGRTWIEDEMDTDGSIKYKYFFMNHFDIAGTMSGVENY